MTNIINIHHKLPFHVPIGRGTKWGNMFSHMEGTTARYLVDSREEAISAYREWILKQPKLLDRLHELWGLTLGCYCKPLPCHGDCLIELINERFSGQTPFRIVVAGGRYFNDYHLLEKKLDKLLEDKIKTHRVIIVSGTAKGADKLGEKYAKERGFLIHRFPADWERYGDSAGFRRNADMAKVSQAAVCFWDGSSRGTKHMIDLANKQGIPTRVIRY